MNENITTSSNNADKVNQEASTNQTTNEQLSQNNTSQNGTYAYYITLPTKTTDSLIGYAPDKFCILFSDERLDSSKKVILKLRSCLAKRYCYTNFTYGEIFKNDGVKTNLLSLSKYPYVIDEIGCFSTDIIKKFSDKYQRLIPYKVEEYREMRKIFIDDSIPKDDILPEFNNNTSINLPSEKIPSYTIATNYNIYIIPVTYETTTKFDTGYFFIYGKNHHKHIKHKFGFEYAKTKTKEKIQQYLSDYFYKRIGIREVDMDKDRFYYDFMLENVNLTKPLHDDEIISNEKLYDTIQDILNHNIV